MAASYDNGDEYDDDEWEALTVQIGDLMKHTVKAICNKREWADFLEEYAGIGEDELSAYIDLVIEFCNRMDETIEEKATEMSELSKNIDVAAKRYTALEKIHSRSKGKAEEMEEELEDSKTNIGELEKEIEDMKVEKQSTAAPPKADTPKAEYVDSAMETSRELAENNLSTTIITSFEIEGTSSVESEENSSQMTQLQPEIEELKAQIIEKDGIIAKKDPEIQDLKNQIVAKDGTITKLAAEIEDLKSQTVTKDGTISNLSSEIEGLKTQSTAKDVMISKLQHENAELAVDPEYWEVAQEDAENAALTNIQAKCDGANQAPENKYLELYEQVCRLNNGLAHLQNLNSAMASNHSQAQIEIERLEDKVRQLESAAEAEILDYDSIRDQALKIQQEVEDRINKYKYTITNLEDEIEDLKWEITHMKEAQDARRGRNFISAIGGIHDEDDANIESQLSSKNETIRRMAHTIAVLTKNSLVPDEDDEIVLEDTTEDDSSIYTSYDEETEPFPPTLITTSELDDVEYAVLIEKEIQNWVAETKSHFAEKPTQSAIQTVISMPPESSEEIVPPPVIQQEVVDNLKNDITQMEQELKKKDITVVELLKSHDREMTELMEKHYIQSAVLEKMQQDQASRSWWGNLTLISALVILAFCWMMSVMPPSAFFSQNAPAPFIKPLEIGMAPHWQRKVVAPSMHGLSEQPLECQAVGGCQALDQYGGGFNHTFEHVPMLDVNAETIYGVPRVPEEPPADLPRENATTTDIVSFWPDRETVFKTAVAASPLGFLLWGLVRFGVQPLLQ